MAGGSLAEGLGIMRPSMLGLCAGARSGPGAGQESCQVKEGEASRRNLVGTMSPYPALELFTVQASTLLGMTPVDFPYTGRAEATNFKFSNREDYGAPSDTNDYQIRLLRDPARSGCARW